MRPYPDWFIQGSDSGGVRSTLGGALPRSSAVVDGVNVPFSHPSELYPQKDGRKVRSCDEGTFTIRLDTSRQGPAGRQAGGPEPITPTTD